MTDEVKLLPCPWCDGEPARRTETICNGGTSQFIECCECFATANSVEQWNTRHPDPRIAELEQKLAALVELLDAANEFCHELKCAWSWKAERAGQRNEKEFDALLDFIIKASEAVAAIQSAKSTGETK